MTLDYISILLGHVLHATKELWEGRKSGQLCGQVVEFISVYGSNPVKVIGLVTNPVIVADSEASSPKKPSESNDQMSPKKEKVKKNSSVEVNGDVKSEENVDEPKPSKKKDKKKDKKTEEVVAAVPSDEASGAKSGKFDWESAAVDVLKNKGSSMKTARLKKKVMKVSPDNSLSLEGRSKSQVIFPAILKGSSQQQSLLSSVFFQAYWDSAGKGQQLGAEEKSKLESKMLKKLKKSDKIEFGEESSKLVGVEDPASSNEDEVLVTGADKEEDKGLKDEVRF